MVQGRHDLDSGCADSAGAQGAAAPAYAGWRHLATAGM